MSGVRRSRQVKSPGLASQDSSFSPKDGCLPSILVSVAERLVTRYRSIVSGGSSTPLLALPRADLAVQTEAAYLRGEFFRPESLSDPGPASASSALEQLADEVELYHDPLLDRFGVYLRGLSGWNRALSDGRGSVITEASVAVHGALLPETVLAAETVLSTYPPTGEEEATLSYGSKDAAQLFRRLLGHVDAKGWEVRLEPDLRARVAVRSASKILVLRESATFSAEELRRLAIHEVGTHVLRTVAGGAQPLTLYTIPNGSHALAVEEGLAVWAEEHAGLLDATTRRRYAGRVLAVRDALTLPYAEVYANARRHFSPRESFELTSRVKRGLRDWNEAGAYVKDKIYLEGLSLVAPAASDVDLRKRLWSGKISELGYDGGDMLVGLQVSQRDPLLTHLRLDEIVRQWVAEVR